MIAGRREGPLMRSNGSPFRRSRIVVAVAVGVVFGCIFAFLYPDGFFRSSRNGVSTFAHVYSSCNPQESRIKTLESQLAILSTKNRELNSQLSDLSAELQLSSQGKPQILQKPGPFGSIKAFRKNPTLLPDPSINPKLAKTLEQIAINNELIVALANSNVHKMLELWFTNIKKLGIKNYIVVALDSNTETFCTNNNVPVYNPDSDSNLDSVAKTGGNHQVSGLKFRILREFLQLGYSILLSDIDIIYIQNPFDYLYRDADIESMTDGHNNMTAYGYNDVFDDPSMGWSRYAHTMRIWVFNSGFFYIRNTIPGFELLDRVANRLANEPKSWDQAVFNEELFFPSHPGYEGLHASKRVMDFYKFMNSKVLFRFVRKDRELRKLKPVIVHVNYHPDKFERAKAVVEFYVDGNEKALDKFPDGSI